MKRAESTAQGYKTVRVFISSTFKDMQAERDYLVRFVFPKLREKLLAYHIHFVDVDLRWGVTGDQDSLATCREVIDQCRPYFMCMLGGRYGWVPPGKSRSITAEEVHYGVLDSNLKDRGYTHFYFRDDAVTDAMVETSPGEYREPKNTSSWRKLAKLKQEIISGGLKPFSYQAQWDKKSKRLTGLKEFGDRVYEDLLTSMKSDPQLRNRFVVEGVQSDEFADENAAMDVYVEEQSERFVLGSRDKVLAELLIHASSTSGNGYVCLTGVPGSGKSALLAQLSRHPKLNIKRSTLMIHHFVGSSVKSSNMIHAIRRFCHELKARCPDITAEIPDDPGQLRFAFPIFLRQACAHKRVVIILDAINKFDPESYAAALHWLPETLPAKVRVILSALEGPALVELRRHCRPHEISLTQLTENDQKLIMEQFLTRFQKRFEPEQRAALLAKTDADLPLYLLAALEELRTLGKYEEITRHITDLPPTTVELFKWILKRLENDHEFRDATRRPAGRELVSNFASLLGASRFGLSQRELTDLLAPKSEEEPFLASDPQGNVAALLHLLRPYLIRRGDLLDFSHDQFHAAASAAYLKTSSQRKDAHTQLANYFNHVGMDRFGIREPNLRVVDELPWQLAQASSWEQLYDLLCDAAFIEYAYIIDRYAIMSYWSQVEQHTPLRMVNGYSEDSLRQGVLLSSQMDTMASLLMNAGHLEQAKTLWDGLQTMSWLDGNKRSYAVLLGRLGLIARAQDRLNEAMSLFKRQEDIARKLEDWHTVSVSLGSQALIHNDRGHRESAMLLHKEEERICRELNDLEGLAACLGNQGVILIAGQDLDNALALLKEEERISRELGIKDQLQLSLGNQAIVLTARNRIDDAMAALKESELICREFNISEGLVRALFNQAFILGVHLDAGDEARQLIEEAREIAREHDLKLVLRELDGHASRLKTLMKENRMTTDRGEARRTKAMKLGKQGAALREAGNLKGAARCYEDQAEIFRESSSLSDLQECLAKLAVIAMERGDGEKAITLSKEQEKICRDINDDEALQEALSLRSGLLGTYALSLEKSGRFAHALQMLEEQEELCGESESYEELQACLGLQARILAAQGKTDDAIVLYERKKEICEAYGFDEGLVICLGNLGTVYTSRGEYERGLGLQREAEAVSRRIGQIDGLVMALANQAAILAQGMNRVSDARPLIDEAMALVRQHSLSSLERQIEPVLRFIKQKERKKWRFPWQKS